MSFEASSLRKTWWRKKLPVADPLMLFTSPAKGPRLELVLGSLHTVAVLIDPFAGHSYNTSAVVFTATF
jgi:hypothetical protein